MSTTFNAYTIELHLETISAANSNAKILYSIWQMNKNQLSKAMDATQLNYPGFSLHEKSHCDTIIKNIEAFLGEERIKSLSPTDAWLILMSAYTHDLGMVIFYKALELKWGDKEFDDFLQKCTNNTFDESLNIAANLILNFKKLSNNSISEEDRKAFDNLSPLKIRNAVSLLNAEFFRKTHHIRSKEILIGLDKDFERLSNTFYCDQLPNRFIKLLGDIAFSHGVNFEFVMNSLQYKSNGFCSDFCHPRFISSMLRLGDVLDVDDKRFNLFYLEAFDKEKPSLTNYHYKKHASVEHILINPESIEITLDCPDENTYRISRDWFDWVLKEGQDQTNNWPEISPRNLNGLPPIIKIEKVKVLLNSVVPSKELMNLKFTISNEKALGLLKGGALYEKTELVFLRELIQNSLDSIKMQIWRDIKNGNYHSILSNYLSKRHSISKAEIESDLISYIQFPDDIPDTIVNNYFINLEINWKDNAKEKLVISVTDNGCGIDENEIIRMSKNVGESRTKTSEYRKEIDDMPFFLRPTGSFGIGLQSLFLINDQFEILTKPEGEKAKSIIFRNPSKGNYSSVSPLLNPKIQRGSSVRIEIENKNFHKAFGNSFTFNVIEQYDYFKDGQGDIYVYKIIEYINEHLRNIPFLKVSIKDHTLWKSSVQLNRGLVFGDERQKERESKLISQLFKINNKYWFRFSENISDIGSEVVLDIKDNFDELSLPHPNYRISFFVRNVKVDSNLANYHESAYCSTFWNLLGSSSDKLLNVSRDKFLRDASSVLSDNFLNKIFPLILKKAHEMLLKEIKVLTDSGTNSDELLKVKTIYFQIALMISISRVKENDIDWSAISTLELPKALFTDVKQAKIFKVEGFNKLKSMAILIPNSYGTNPYKENLDYENIIKDFSKEINSLKCEAIVRFDSFLHDYIQINFNIDKIITSPKQPGYRVLIFKKSSPNSKESIAFDKSAENAVLNELVSKSTNARSDRKLIYSLPKYAKYLAIKNTWFKGFENFPRYSKSCIISPFMSNEDFNFYFEVVKKDNRKKNKEITKSLLEDQILSLVPDSLIDAILQHSYYKPKDINKRKIIDAYIELATDYIHHIWR